MPPQTVCDRDAFRRNLFARRSPEGVEQMDMPAQLEAIDRETLTRPIRRMLQSDTVELLDWQFRPLRGGSGNPVSLGLYRFAGSGRDQGKAVPWSLVLKVAQSPANVGATDMGEGQDRTHWNYWKREMYVYQSSLLDSLPAGLAAPRCFGVEERPGNVIWLWLRNVSSIVRQLCLEFREHIWLPGLWTAPTTTAVC